VNHQRSAKKRSAPTVALTVMSAIVPERPSGWANKASTNELAPRPTRLVIRPTARSESARAPGTWKVNRCWAAFPTMVDTSQAVMLATCAPTRPDINAYSPSWVAVASEPTALNRKP